MGYTFRSAGNMNPGAAKMIREVVEECRVCRQNGRLRSRPVVAIPRVSDFNAVVAFDFKEFGKVCVLWMVCALTRMMKGVVLKDRRQRQLWRVCTVDGV